MVLMSSDLDFVPGRWDPDLGSDVLGPGHPKPGSWMSICWIRCLGLWCLSVCSTTVLGARDAYATETFISLQLSHLLLLVKDIDSGVITN